jgi:hypothetical protein
VNFWAVFIRIVILGGQAFELIFGGPLLLLLSVPTTRTRAGGGTRAMAAAPLRHEPADGIAEAWRLCDGGMIDGMIGRHFSP